MNTFVYVKSNFIRNRKYSAKRRSSSKLALVSMLSICLILGSSGAFASAQKNESSNSDYVHEILVNTQEAINYIETNPSESLVYVTNSLDLINKIESNFNENTMVDINEAASRGDDVAYTHYLPKLDIGELQNSETLPILNKKLESNILYIGNNKSNVNLNDAWFDYTFAKASLVSVREALNANHSVEAIRNLKRVYEAIYVAPDFNVSE